MKVVHINWTIGYGGIETMLINIANLQYRAGVDVTIIIVNEVDEESLLSAFLPGVKIILLHRSHHSKNPMSILKMNRILKRIKPDIIHLHSSRFYKLIFSRRLSRVACVTLHALPTGSVRRKGWLFHTFPFFFYSGNVNCIDEVPRVFAITQAVKDALWRDYGVNSIVVSNGIMTSRFQQRPPQTVSRPMRIVEVSRLAHDKKGQDLLIEAVSRLKGLVTVDFIGSGDSLDYLNNLTHQLGVESCIRFLGKKSQEYIAEHLKDYDLFVQPSRYDGFGLTVAEAMAAQVPLLVSEGQGPAEVTCGNRYGWTFKNGDTDDLKDTITYILTHYDEAQKKAIEALKHVEDTYDVSITAKRYLDEYTKIIQANKKR